MPTIIWMFNNHPHQNVYFNLLAGKNFNEKFEMDYWGVSNKNLNKRLVEYVDQNSISKDICVYGDEYVKYFLTTKVFNCFKRYNELDSAKIRPALAY